MTRGHLSPGATAELACVIEASCHKPGNVHPDWSFEDTSYFDFIASAAAVGPVLDRARRQSLGRTVLEATRATQALVGKNTNLGMVLLLAPLAALGDDAFPRASRRRSTAAVFGVQARRRLRRAVQARLGRSNRRDADLVYEAIRLARPGGLGRVGAGDVHAGPEGTLIEMMAQARRRDLVARQYANGYKQVIDEGLPIFERALREDLDLEESVTLCFLELLGRHGDSLIARKSGESASRAAARRAAGVLRAGWPRERKAARRFESLERWLRADNGKRNPGTSADLTAAVLFLALRGGIIPLPIRLRRED